MSGVDQSPEKALRGTGGNRFIPGDADRIELVLAVQRGLHDLHVWAEDTGRAVDVGAITVTTRRIPSGSISVSVSGDLIVPSISPGQDGPQ